MRGVGERIEARAGLSLADRTEGVTLDAVRGGGRYRLVIEIEA